MPRRNYYSYYSKKPSSAVVALNTIIIILLSITILLIGLYLFSHFSGYTLIPFDKINFPWTVAEAVNADEVKVIEPVSSYGTQVTQNEHEPAPVQETSETTAESVSETTTIAIVVGNAEEEVTTVETEPRIQFRMSEYSDEFYSNTLFIGDSIFTGFAAFEYLPPENVFAQVGLNPDSILTKKINDVTVFEKAAAMQPERICIMLGTNGLAFLDIGYMADNMKTVVNDLKAMCPETEIALISIPPVTAEREKENPEKIPLIVKYNSYIKEAAEETDCRYIDIYSELVDETGYFAADYAEVDGMHFVGVTYKLVLTIIQYAFTGDENLVILPEGMTSPVTENAESAVTEVTSEIAETVTETTPFTVQIVVPDAAAVEETEAGSEEAVETVAETEAETTVFTVDIIV